jgi:hypothetical protein
VSNPVALVAIGRTLHRWGWAVVVRSAHGAVTWELAGGFSSRAAAEAEASAVLAGLPPGIVRREDWPAGADLWDWLARAAE